MQSVRQGTFDQSKNRQASWPRPDSTDLTPIFQPGLEPRIIASRVVGLRAPAQCRALSAWPLSPPDDAEIANDPMRRLGEVGAQPLLLFLRLNALGGALQELEDVLHDVTDRTGRMDHAAGPVPFHVGAEHQA